MARTKSTLEEIKRGLGTSLEVISRLAEGIQALGGDDQHLRLLLTNPALVERIARMLVPYIEPVTLEPTAESVEDLLVAGRYLNVVPGFGEIAERYRTAGNYKYGLLRLDRDATHADVMYMMHGLGITPAAAYDLSRLGAQHPYIDRKSPIVAAGWYDDGRRVVRLYSTSTDRYISTPSFQPDLLWTGSVRFLVHW